MPRPDHIPPEAVSLFDIAKLAQLEMPEQVRDYVAGGAGDEITVGANSQAYQRIQLRPRALVDVSRLDTRVVLHDQELSLPLLIAPTAYHRLVHPDGECATARAAAAAGITYVISSATTTPLEAIAAAAPGGTHWFQLYLLPTRASSGALVQTAEQAGVRALVLTVDTPVAGTRNREQRSRVQLPPGVTAPYFHHVASVNGGASSQFQVVTWQDVDWLRAATTLPLWLKGIMTPEDARLAVDHGVAGIIVSNHGGRNLDTTPATIAVLPDIADAVAGRLPILIDGGIRRGTDMVKALAIGASAVLVGRPILDGLAAAGQAGVAAVLNILKTEFRDSLALMGRPVAANLDRTALWP
jgi:4-hydroxymandelate oxidase